MPGSGPPLHLSKAGGWADWFTRAMTEARRLTLPMKMQSPGNARPVADLVAATAIAEFLVQPATFTIIIARCGRGEPAAATGTYQPG